MGYALDADAFIGSNERHYPFSICPGYWDWLENAHCSLGLLGSVEAIRVELSRQEDDLWDWVQSLPDQFFPKPDQGVVQAFTALATWAQYEPQYSEAGRSEFLDSGEFALIAYAMAHNHTVVTYEKSRPGSINKIKAPDACKAVGVECISPFEMLQREGVQFVLLKN